jgi:hypothetical protein
MIESDITLDQLTRPNKFGPFTDESRPKVYIKIQPVQLSKPSSFGFFLRSCDRAS